MAAGGQVSLQTQVQTGGGRMEAGPGLLPGGGDTAAWWGENTPSSPDQLLTSS